MENLYNYRRFQNGMGSVDHLIKKIPDFLPNILNPIYVSHSFLTITQDSRAIVVLIGLLTTSP